MTPPGIYLGLVMSETAYDHTTGVYRASLKTGYTSDHLGAVAGLPKSVVRHELRHRTVAVRPSNTSAGSGRCHHRELDAAHSGRGHGSLRHYQADPTAPIRRASPVGHGLQLLGWAFTERGADAASESTLELI